MKINLGKIIKIVLIFIILSSVFVMAFPSLRTEFMGQYKGIITSGDPIQSDGYCLEGQNSYYNSNAKNPNGVPVWEKSVWDLNLGVYVGRDMLPPEQVSSIVCHAPNATGKAPLVNAFGV